MNAPKQQPVFDTPKSNTSELGAGGPLSSDQVEEFYRQAAERMADLPLFNQRLSVALTGWQPNLDGHWFGVLITPWCMNLWAQPCRRLAASPDFPMQQSSKKQLPPGSHWLLSLPGGDYELTLAYSDTLGSYASGSLVSVMSCFECHQDAVETAESIIKLLLEPVEASSTVAPIDTGVTGPRSTEAPDNQTADTAQQESPRRLSRRGFLAALTGQGNSSNGLAAEGE